MIRCSRCAQETPRRTDDQRYCPRCAVEVRELIRADTERRNRVVWRAGDSTPWSGRPAA